METPPERQRVARLTPLAEVFERMTALAHPVAPKNILTARACGRVLAADVALDGPWPPSPVALWDGWAVRAADVADASAYAPIHLDPAPVFVANGDIMPSGTDAVLAPDAVNMRGTSAEVLADATPGEGVLAQGGDVSARVPIGLARTRLDAVAVAALRAARITHVAVREPRVRIVAVADIHDPDDVVSPLIAYAVEQAGGAAGFDRTGRPEKRLEQALGDETADAIFVIGGTGEGPHDASVRILAGVGRVEVHGVALRPGETAALGTIGVRPVLMLPGRLDAALAVWLTVGRALVARLTGSRETERGRSMTLMRKVTSTIGLAEIVPIGPCGGGVEPLASGYFPLQALARAEGWIMIAPDSEGFAAGASVEVIRFT